MFKNIMLKISFLFCCLIAAQVYAASSSEAELSQLKAMLSQVESLQGTFKQKISTEQGKVLQQCEGKMWLKKPGQFRWEVQGKDKRLVVANGKQVWDYDVDLEQVTIQQLSKGQNSAPIFFLTGDVNSLSQDFNVSLLNEKENVKGSNGFNNSDQVFELKPKASQGSFQWIRIGFKNKALSELEMLDHLGQRSSFVFNNLQLNTNISNKLFQFTPPKGVDVVGF